MHQKYVISRDVSKSILKIREYAVIDTRFKKAAFAPRKKGSFTFLCEETYESDMITSSISKGLNALVSILRTDNMFPIEPNATRIAESVVALYDSPQDNPVELVFDDTDSMPDRPV